MNKEETDILQQGTDAVSKLLQVFQQLIDISVGNCLKNIPEQIVQLSHDVHKIDTKQQQLLYGFEPVKQQLENLTSTNKLLEKAGETNQLLGKQHYVEHIIQPMIRTLFPVLDLIRDAQKHWVNSQETTELLNGIWSQMEQFLATYDVNIIKHRTNHRFNPQIMKPIKWAPTEDSQLNGCIAESLQIGFQLGKERILRPESVALFKLQPSQTNNVNNLFKE